MKFIKTDIDGCFLITYDTHVDERGFFAVPFNKDEFNNKLGYEVNFIQDNLSWSHHSTIRGLHFQRGEHAQAKLVTCTQGLVLDVAVDIRKGSPTFGQQVVVELSEQNKRQMFVPRGFAHGFVVLEDETVFAYKVDNYYSPENDRGLAFDDASLLINWRVPKDQLQLSAKDTRQPSLANAELFDFGSNLYA